MGDVLTSCSGPTVGEQLINDPKIELVSFTGSTKIGRHVNETVAKRFGKTILELGGNNAMIVHSDADLEMALRATVFAAVGTCGQRCTTLRRLYLHEDIHDAFLEKLVAAYKTVQIGDPLKDGTLCGPLHNTLAVNNYANGLKEIEAQKGKILIGGKVRDGPGHFVEPTLVSIDPSAPIVQVSMTRPINYKFDHRICSMKYLLQLRTS